MYMDDNERFYHFLDSSFVHAEHIVWTTALVIHERYKDKYSFLCYETDLWVAKNDSLYKQAKQDFMNDIQNLSDELFAYNVSRQNKYINIIANKLRKDGVFMKSIMHELRELFFQPM